MYISRKTTLVSSLNLKYSDYREEKISIFVKTYVIEKPVICSGK